MRYYILSEEAIRQLASGVLSLNIATKPTNRSLLGWSGQDVLDILVGRGLVAGDGHMDPNVLEATIEETICGIDESGALSDHIAEVLADSIPYPEEPEEQPPVFPSGCPKRNSG